MPIPLGPIDWLMYAFMRHCSFQICSHIHPKSFDASLSLTDDTFTNPRTYSVFENGFMAPCNQKLYELIFRIYRKFILLWLWWSNQVITVHMPRQLSCRAMCKIVTQYYHFSRESGTYFCKIWSYEFIICSWYWCLRRMPTLIGDVVISRLANNLLIIRWHIMRYPFQL